MQWGRWTTPNFERVFLNAPDPIINTLIFAGIATALSLIISTLASYVIVKKRNMLTPALDCLSTLPLALSGTVIGIGLVMTFNTGWLTLTGTAAIIVIAYVVRRLPFGIRNASATLYNISGCVEEASISLGVLVYPSDGTFTTPEFLVLAKNAPNPAAAKRANGMADQKSSALRVFSRG